MRSDATTRRRFLSLAPAAALLALVGAGPLRASPSTTRRRKGRRGDHPDPRPEIDASKVLKAGDLQNPAAAPVYDMVREMPHVVDGIRCYCGCADIPGYYSLLTCYEEGGMAQVCEICQGQARAVHTGWTKGHSLDEIRAAVDFRYG